MRGAGLRRTAEIALQVAVPSWGKWAGTLFFHVDQALDVVASEEWHVFSEEAPFSGRQIPEMDLATGC